MTRSLAFTVLSLIAALCIALASVASATMMAPVGENAPEYQAYLASGGADDGLCTTHSGGHADHACPFCTLLSDPGDIRVAPVVWQLVPHAQVQNLANLTTPNQWDLGHLPARGPPQLT